VPLDQAVRRIAIAALASVLSAAALAAGKPGDFDFYVLALTWEPSYCASALRADPVQCESGGALFGKGFVVHGLWPQYERGWPEYCAPARRLPASVVASVADLLAPDLAQHEWDRHGVCTALRPQAYFDLTRRAYEKIAIPGPYESVGVDIETSPGEIEANFIAANPGLSARGFAVACDGVIEVRICLTRLLGFRRCPEVDERSCRERTVTLPAME
jgi:ribonuclease T2